MKAFVMTTLLGFATGVLFAADNPVFQVRAVVETPTSGSREYSLSQRNGASEKVHLEEAVLLDHTALDIATVENDQRGKPGILITLNEEGAKRFSDITREHLGKRLGIVVAGKLVLAPVVQEQISGESIQVSGRFTEKEAVDIAAKPNRASPAGSRKKELNDWIYPSATSASQGRVETGGGVFAAAGGLFSTNATFDEVFAFYAKKADIPADSSIHSTDQGRLWKIWADSPIKAMVTRSITDHQSHASFLFQRPGAYSAAIAISRAREDTKTQISVSLLSEFYRNNHVEE